MTLQELFSLAAENVTTIFKERGELAPMWHAIPEQGEHLLICTPWEGPDEKHAIVGRLRELFRQKRVKQYVFMCEAWSLAQPSLEGVNAWIGRFNEHPDRREILTIQAEDTAGHSIMGWYYILRPEHGPAKLSPLQMSEADHAEGALTGLLR